MNRLPVDSLRSLFAPAPDADALGRAVEALAFAAERPVSPSEVARVFGAVTGLETSAAEVEAAVVRLNELYAATGRAFRLHTWAGGYRLATEPDVAPFVRALVAHEDEQRLSRAILETLAVVAYRQPVSKPEVDHVRGVSADYALRQLLERDLVTVVGRGEGVGRPLLYGTTERFLDLFGLGTLDELPRPREIEEILADPAFARERAALMAEGTPPETTPPGNAPPETASPGNASPEAVPPEAASPETVLPEAVPPASAPPHLAEPADG